MSTPMLASSPTSPLEAIRAPFRAIAATVVPEMERLDEAQWMEVEAIVAAQLAARAPALRRQFALFVRLVDLVPLARHGRRFHRLDAERRLALLERLERAPVALVRRGVWGVRTLAFMGHYTRPSVMAALGYRAHPRGWLARRPAAARQPVELPTGRPVAPPPQPPPSPRAEPR